ncbi:MAG: MFS transporter [Syntrophorhabdaceae bacterium]|nr:MFS transporter [Syntrophorhabdaceae bacterium]
MNKTVASWCLFDFANSSFSAVIAATIFPVYYANYIVGNTDGHGDLWWGRAISLSMAIVAIASPFLGGIADYGGIRKRLLIFLTTLSIFGVASLSLLDYGMVIEGFILIVMANIGMEGGIVFYNSFLSEITEKKHQGRVSAWGFGIGYGGSILSLFLALLLINHGFIRLVWVMVALFFGLFAIPAFIFLPKDRTERGVIKEYAWMGFKQTITTMKHIGKERNLRRFLIAYLIYEDGINTVIVFSSIYAATTLGFKNTELVYMYLLVQATALIGAFFMAKRIDLWGPKKVVVLSLNLWILTVILTFFASSKVFFAFIAGVAGFGLGTIQAASRAFFAQFLESGRESEYFGIYSLVGKSSAIIGPLFFGFLSSTYRSQRPAILSVLLFFVIGLILIFTVKGGRPNIVERR